MRHKAELVVLEAARAIVTLPNATGRDLGPAMTMLHMFLASHKVRATRPRVAKPNAAS